MSHPNRLYNGDFARDLSNWDVGGNAAFVANQGSKELGACSLPDAGSYVEQSFSIGVGRPYMLEVSVKGTGSGLLTLTITDSAGNTTYTTTLTVTTAWAIQPAARVGLAWGDYTLRLAYNNVACYVDDVSIAWVVKTRSELAELVADRLGVLASGANFSTTPGDDTDTEGDFTAAIDEGLRAVSACDPAGRPDVRYLDTDGLTGCLDEIELSMLKRLHRYWSTKTDYNIGPRQERLNQISGQLLALTGGAVGGRPASAGRGVKVRKLTYGGGV